jgi:hypothetical protein
MNATMPALMASRYEELDTALRDMPDYDNDGSDPSTVHDDALSQMRSQLSEFATTIGINTELEADKEKAAGLGEPVATPEAREAREEAVSDAFQQDLKSMERLGMPASVIGGYTLEMTDRAEQRIVEYPELIGMSLAERREFEALEKDIQTTVELLDGGDGDRLLIKNLDAKVAEFSEKSAAHDRLGERVMDKNVELLQGPEEANHYIRTLAQELREGGLTEEQEEIMERTLVAELHKELGDEGMAELDRGHFEVLEDILPSKYDQIGVCQEYLEIAAEERGVPELSDLAGELQQQKVTEKANEATIEENRKDRGLDDDMGL